MLSSERYVVDPMSVCDLEKKIDTSGQCDLDITVHVNRVCFAWATSELLDIINKAMFMFIHRSTYWSVVVDFKKIYNS